MVSLGKEGRKGRREGVLFISLTPRRVNKIAEAISRKQKDINFTYVSTIDELQDILKTTPPQVAILANVTSFLRNSFEKDLQVAQLIANEAPYIYQLMLIDNRITLSECESAIKLGIRGFINIEDENFDEILRNQIKSILEKLQRRPAPLDAPIKQVMDITGIATQSDSMIRILHQAKKAAMVSDAPVIIEGESGTGKQLLAEAIHKADPKRKDKPFIAVNCAAITGTLAESALFGHKKGAFTGATESRLGYFRAANGGTLLLDEISELDKSLQPKLLRVLQEGKILPVGDDKEYPVDVRVISATNKSLADEVTKGNFRLDLYQRLNVIKLRIPPLRERVEDIPLLVHYFLRKYRHYYSGQIKTVDPGVYVILRRAIGKGNVRELENIIRQALVFKTDGSVLTVSDLPSEVLKSAWGELDSHPDKLPAELAKFGLKKIIAQECDLGRLLESLESEVISLAIREYGLKGAKLARMLGLTRRTLYNKLKKYNLSFE